MQVGPSGDLPPSPDTPEVAGIEEPSTERAVSPEKVFPPWTDRGFFLSGRKDRMNTINVIAPYKHLDMWVFDDPRVGLSQGADAMIDRVGSPTFRGRSVASRWSSPRRLSPVISTGSIGSAPMATVIGIAPQTSIWKAGFALPCFDISTKRRSTSTLR